ncbi:uncharacterized protein RJT20DRAFT_150054 [Scheffersomyces xylosifermentans]|uniref:uncharacterized protein n=1 Tax=Scheffersomyces xylosifermentans TaxID=1304137 RepID=UPI00315CBDC2
MRTEKFGALWFNPLSKFSPRKKVEIQPQVVETIIEEPSEGTASGGNANYVVKLKEIKHYTRSSEIPPKLRLKILTTKLSEFVQETEAEVWTRELIKEFDSVFMDYWRLLKREGKDLTSLKLDTLIVLFGKSSKPFIDNQSSPKHQQRVTLPVYLSLVIPFLLSKESHEISPKVLVLLVDLGSSLKDLDVVLQSLFANKGDDLSPEFSNELIEYYENKDMTKEKKEKLLSQVYESVIKASINIPKINLIDDEFYSKYISFLESLFREVAPKTHEYLNLERSIDYIHYTNNQLLSHIPLEKTSIGSLLHLVKLTMDLLSVSNDRDAEDNIKRILDYIVQKPNAQTFATIQEEIFKQDIEDETLVETILFLSWTKKEYHELALILSEFIMSDDVKFSDELRIQAAAYVSLHMERKSEIDLYETVRKQIESQAKAAKELNYVDLHLRIMQALVGSEVSARGVFTEKISKYFIDNYHIEPSLYSYKHRLDKAIKEDNFVEAIEIFDDSVSQFIQWHSSSDPAVFKTLNDLIVILCKHMDNIERIFPIFQNIKRQMLRKANIDAVSALSLKMLQAEYVGDLIEMLKRELPEIDKDSSVRLPSERVFGTKYRELFEILHKFVVNYENEETFETNWVLYGELHKFFNLPFEFYMPTIRFFCEHDRLHAALLIFRQIRKNFEVHNQAPPTREMYMYLFKEFGEKLYEDGVNEMHGYIKLDINLPQQDIALQNSILNAFSNLQDVPRARELFLSISSNPKKYGGINEETIQIIIKTYTYHDLAYVKKFWNNLSQFDIIPNYAIYRQYLIAHVYHGYAEEAIQLIDEMADYDLEVTSDTILALHNYCLEKDGQKKIAEWAQQNHPEKWKELITSNLLVGATNYMPSDNLIAGSS